jgi:hypothetical protein
VIEDQAKYEADKANCTNIAMTYSLTDERLIKAGYMAVAAGSSVAGLVLRLKNQIHYSIGFLGVEFF